MIDEDKIRQAVHMMIEAIGEDPERPGMAETPERIARMCGEIYGGMDEDVSVHLSKTFDVEDNEIVVEKDISFYSTCEHHLMPFFGVAHVAYVPDGKVVGLSKLARVVDVFARRAQIQEHMGVQIADAVMEHLRPRGVMVVLEAEHLCMTMRGIKKPGTKTVSMVSRGVFETDRELRRDFLDMTGR